MRLTTSWRGRLGLLRARVLRDPAVAWAVAVRAEASGRPLRCRAIEDTGAGVLVDVGGLQGLVRRDELLWAARACPGRCVGTRLECVVISARPERGELLLSSARAARARCDAALAAGRAVRGQVVRANNGGLLIDIGGMRGFLPCSLMTYARRTRYRDLVGRRWRGYLVQVTREQVILSDHRVP